MKKVLLIAVALIIAASTLNAQKAKVNYEPKGKWNFEAPYAPEGFTSGAFEVGQAENKLTAIISFTGNEARIPLENVKFESDTLRASLYLEGETVSITVKFDEADKMSGKATSSQGDIPLVLVREKKKQ